MKEDQKKTIWPFVVLIAITLLALILAAVLLLGGGVDSDWQEQYDLGRRYLEDGNYEEAILAFSAAIEIDPKRAEAYLGRGEAYMELGDYESALEDFEKARRRDPDNEEIEEKIRELDKQAQERMKELTYAKYVSRDGGYTYTAEWEFGYNEAGLLTSVDYIDSRGEPYTFLFS